ncbi:hypothetical protein [Streptomyces sp. WAC01526]|uniref:hypothetical protein n=1 Tax=Streptomyces sp. WAC01526 TaxID=2588709 RepID=UPI0011E026B9|nr:hypothetical protein [Streptomyces sp. WAC01526]
MGWPAGLAVYEFNGRKEGHLRLWIRTLAEPEPNHVALLTHSGSWSAPTLAWPGAKNPSAPALAFHAGDLYCAVRGVGDQIWVSRRQGSSWSTFAMVPGHLTRRPPALASFNGRLYLAHTAHNGQTVVTSSTNGKDWSAQRPTPSPPSPPAAPTTSPSPTAPPTSNHSVLPHGPPAQDT